MIKNQIKKCMLFSLLLCLSTFMVSCAITQNINSKTIGKQAVKSNLSGDFQHISVKYKSLSKKVMNRNYYSPDYRIFVKEEIDGIQDEVNSYLNKIYLSTSVRPIDNIYQEALEQSLSITPAVWISNDRIIIKGEYIYNVRTNKIEKRIMEEIIKNGTLLSYAVNNDLNKISYSIINDGKIDIYIYNLDNDIFKKIYSENTAMTSRMFLSILWDSKNNIYFNVTDNGETFKILKYDFIKKSTSVYFKNGVLINNSSDKKYLVVGNIEKEETIIFDLSNGKKFTIPYSIELIWLPNQYTFLYIPIKDNKSIYICSIDDKIIQKKLLNIQDIRSEDEIVQNLRYEKNEILFDLVKYEYPEYKYLIEYSKTYYIK